MFELTKPQQLIYNMEKFTGGSIAIICGSVLFDGCRDAIVLKNAVNKLLELNDAFRIHLRKTEGGVKQAVSDFVEQQIEVLHFNGKDELDLFAEQYAKETIDIYGDLCEIRPVVLPHSYGLLVKLHHIIGDAWSLSLIGTQFRAILNGEVITTYSYLDYVNAESSYLQSSRHSKDQAYFLEQFKSCDDVTYLSDKENQSFVAHRKTFVVEGEQAQQISAYAKENNVSPYALFLTTLAIYINRIKMNTEQFYIGTAVLNRSNAREKNTAGMFINTVPVRIKLNNEGTFVENLHSVQKTTFSVFRHQKYNYGDVLTAVRKEYGFTEKLYDVVLSYQNASISKANDQFETKWYHNGMQTESLQMHIDDRDSQGVFRLNYDYQIDKFSEHDIDRMHQHICSLLFDALRDDSNRICDLRIMPASEEEILLGKFNDTATYYPKEKCIHQLFEEQVAETPNRVALKFGDREFTFSTLNSLANGLAAELRNCGIGTGDIVGIMSKRSYHIVVAMLAIFKCGAAYLPIDYNYPLDRINAITEDAHCKAILTYNVDYAADNVVAIPERISPLFENFLSDVSSEDICGIIYTSGSTGEPKGTLLHHKGLVNYTFANNALYEGGSCNIGFAIYTFDAFFLDLIPPMLRGGISVMATEEEQFNQLAFEHLIRNNPDCNLFITPAKLKQFLDNAADKFFYRRIHSICIGGEVFPPEFVGKFSKNTKVYNVYGPTECSMWVLEHPIIDDDIALGRPLANVQIYILDRTGSIVPVGVTGELCIAGDSVGAGYLNRPELTAEKFIDNPFGKGKLYKTGDLAYWRDDGTISYIGRNDFQVKIRGLRIELGDIESAICGIDGISQAVTVVRKNNEGRQLICAFYTGKEIDPKEIRVRIGKKLPKYMLPHIVMHLSEMPLTASGKTNRKALPEINLDSISSKTNYVLPRNDTEKSLCGLIERVLHTQNVGIEDDFFDLGGDSLKAMEFVSGAHNMGIYFSLQDVFDNPSVKQLCESAEKKGQQLSTYEKSDFSDINKLLEHNRVECIVGESESHEIGNILLAGATGYLGIHILAEYLDKCPGIACCIIRGKNQTDSVNRLRNNLNFYFGNKYTDMSRIKVYCADLQKDKFGLTNTEYGDLLKRVNTVINSAASVKHYGIYQDFYKSNVETVKNIIHFCKKADAKLIHISTLSVSGNGFDKQRCEKMSFSENSFYIGQPLDNVYAKSKFEAEKEVFCAMLDGLQANIMRMGNLTNRLQDGVFQMNWESNAFFKRVKAMVNMEMYPMSLATFPVEFSPVDEAAEAVMILARYFDSTKTVFHINNPKHIELKKLFDVMNSLGTSVYAVDDKMFSSKLKSLSIQEEKNQILEAFVNDMSNSSEIVFDSNITINNNFTVQYLRRLGFEWSDIGKEYLNKYLDSLKKLLV